jgi:DNA (cytosine-5)-methyltransferase 1
MHLVHSPRGPEPVSRATKPVHSRSGSRPTLNAISLFAGGGGLDLGLDASGFNTAFASDIDPQSNVSLQWGRREAARLGKNLLRDCVVYRDDVQNLTGGFILDATKLNNEEVALLAGGPPCQAFSVFGKRRGRADSRGMLVYEYLRLLSELRPHAFVFENVSGLLTVEKGAVFHDVCEKLKRPSAGLRYTLSVLRLNAVDYGVPQFRDRVFIVGTRNGKTVEAVPPVVKSAEHLSGPAKHSWRTVRDAFKSLPPIGSEYPANHTGRTHSDRIVRRYSSMKPGARDSFTRINKLDLNRPSYTIIVGSDKGGGKGHIHPTEAREVTPRESARIQTFPDWWAFAGSVRHPIRQIGNAVPPLLASAVGNAIREQVFDLSPIPFDTVLSELDQTHLFEQCHPNTTR